MKEPTDQPEFDSKEETCKVCGDAAYENPFGFFICNACKNFLYNYLNSKKIHNPCRKNQQCITTLSTLKECPCCFLKKCVNLKMDPYYEMRCEIARHVNTNRFRGSFPYHPCPTCASNQSPVSEELNHTSSDDRLQITSEENMGDTLTVSSSQPYEPCKVCGLKADGIYHSVLTCDACRSFFYNQVTSGKEHKPCPKNRQCIITESNRKECPCCRLKKCLAVGMDPAKVTSREVINYDKIANLEPREWFVLHSCKTCDSKKVRDINESIRNLKSSFMKAKENGSYSITVPRG